jgi:hypothetical protein
VLKKTITYIDFEGVSRTETFYFNLTKAEILKMELSEAGGLKKLIEKIVAEKDNTKLLDLFQEVVVRSYGEKSADGKQFMKSQAITDKFTSTQAFSDLFMELATNDTEAAAFINGLLPKDLVEQPK